MSKIIWRNVRHNGETCSAYCGRVEDNGKYFEKCSAYDPEHMCRICIYITGKVIDEEVEEA